MAGVEELCMSLVNAQKDVESKAATIKHLQNALNAKSMTIDILCKHNKEGGNLEDKIAQQVEEKTEAVVKKEEDETVAGRAMADVEELCKSLVNAQKDVESKAATIKHLQNALNAKS